jgi:thiamine-monophosphate kinase
VVINLDSTLLVVDEVLTSAAGAFNGNAMEWVLTGGEDHAFVATFADALEVPAGWTVIGHVSAGRAGVLVDGEPYAEGGWHHFEA